MNPTITQNNSQGSNPLPHKDLSAALAFATNLHEGMMPQAPQEQPVEAPQTPQEAPGQAQQQETGKEATPSEHEVKMTKLELDMTQKIDDLRTELDSKHKLELDNLKNEIKQALDETEQESKA